MILVSNLVLNCFDRRSTGSNTEYLMNSIHLRIELVWFGVIAIRVRSCWCCSHRRGTHAVLKINNNTVRKYTCECSLINIIK